MKNIVVFFDGSAEARKAFGLAVEIAATYNAKLLIIGAISASEAEGMLDRGQDVFGEEFSQLCHQARGSGIQCQYRFDVGDPVKQILHAAEDRAANLIVMGRRPLTEMLSLAISPLAGVITYANCAVTAV
jgi:nucleotide-binding universal stress UspA family protein